MPERRGRKDSLLRLLLWCFLFLMGGLRAPLPAQPALAVEPALIARMVANQQAAMKRLEQYCFRQQVLFEKLDDHGKVEEADRREELVCYCDGVPLFRQLAMNGRPTGQSASAPWPAIKQDENWKKQVRRAAERSQRFQDVIADIPKAFDFARLGEELVDGRLTDVYGLSPKPGYRAKSRPTEMLRHVTGRAWVDRETAHMVRLQALVEDDFDMWGGLILKVHKGATYELRQKPLKEGWVPYFAEERWHARIALFKHMAQHQRLERTDFRPASLFVAKK